MVPTSDVTGCSLLLMKTNMAYSGSSFMCLRMTNRNCARVSSNGTMNLFFLSGWMDCNSSLHSTTTGMRSGCCFKMMEAFNFRSSNGIFLRYLPKGIFAMICNDGCVKPWCLYYMKSVYYTFCQITLKIMQSFHLNQYQWTNKHQ